ncbi:hypothetical protein RUND412_007265 [Rhizina undulata]
MASNPTSSIDKDAALKSELATLRVLRATLESVKQLVAAIHDDAETAAANCKQATGLHKRWQSAIEHSNQTQDNPAAEGKLSKNNM